jgi:UDP-N-acetylglucosamine 4,6-dehydratase
MRVLITGGTGSLGHALVRHFLKETDWRLVVLSRDELKQARMREVIPEPRLDFRLGDVRDIERLNLAFYGVDVVIHTAALKRVDAVAGDPVEVYKTNVQGTWNVLQAALSNGVPKVLFISSDKACHPINAYGASKFAAESLVVSFNQYGYPQGTWASVVRYGNVLGSRGSVIHVWRDQLARGKALTVTSPEMTRFIITLPQAVALVHATIDRMEGGEVFVPRLPAARMIDLAAAIADPPYNITGLRPGGEKLHEILLTEEEADRSRDAGFISLITPHLHPWIERPAWEDEPKTMDGECRSDTVRMISVKTLREMIQQIPENGI